MRDFYCTYEAEMPEAAVRGSLVDRRYRGEQDVRAADVADARKRLEAYIAESRPGDRLISCECTAF